MRPNLPRRIWRVTWLAAVGYPDPTTRKLTTRNYGKAEDAGRQVQTIRAMPSHLSLQHVHVSDEITWRPVDPDTLPVPPEVEDEDVDA